jgi:hypothetical protein
MASFKFEMSPEWEKAMYKLDTLYDDVSADMLNAGTAVVAGRLKGTKFGKYVKVKKPKKNQYGWFSQVQFRGTVESGTKAAIAATVYEYGRGGRAPQPARPEIRPTVQASEGEAVKAMEEVLKEALKKL